jgi:PAS domain S-box-containing protein
MPENVLRVTSPKHMNTALFVVAAGLLLFTGYLVLSNYRSQVQLRDTAVERFERGTSQRAAALSHFFNERLDDLNNLAESRVVDVYFENQALGMSMAYGLRASLVAIRQRLLRLIQNKTYNDQPIFKTIVLLDSHGKVIIGSQDPLPAESAGKIPFSATLEAQSTFPPIVIHQQSFMLNKPVFFKKQIVGWVAGCIEPHYLCDQLAEKNSGSLCAAGIIVCSDRLFSFEPDSAIFAGLEFDLIDRLPVGKTQLLHLTQGRNKADGKLAFKIPVTGTPLTYIGLIAAEDVFGRSAPWHIPAALTVISALLFCGLVFLLRQNTINMVLHARLDEAAKREQEIAEKNLGLENQIRKRREVETRLRDSELRFRNLVESIKDWFWEVDPKGVYIYAGPQVTALLGYDPGEVLGKSVFDFMTPEEKERVEKIYKALVAERKPIELLRNALIHKDGRRVVVETSGLPIYDTQARFCGFRGTDRDITEKVKLEERLQQAQKMESIGTLAGGIAHDFNNILGIMVGNAELALDDVPPWNPGYQNLQEIKTAGLRAAHIVKQLLSFSRKSEQKLKPVEIKAIIQDSLNLLRATMPSTVEIRENFATAEGTILADPIQINQVIMNLCINASQAMEDEGGVIEVRALQVALGGRTGNANPGLPEGDYIKISVSDTGQGIDPQIIDKIFDPYFTTKEVGRGSGMGLAVVHGIVKNHSGGVTVDSIAGQGATFNVFFPLAEESAEVEFHETEALQRGRETILVVDDEPSIVYMTAQMLRRMGYHVEAKVSPHEAIELLQSGSQKIDLVISDMTMPQMTGIQLFEKVKKIRPDIPVIICTGHSDLINHKKAKELGIAALAMKPITRQTITKAVRDALDGNKWASPPL